MQKAGKLNLAIVCQPGGFHSKLAAPAATHCSSLHFLLWLWLLHRPCSAVPCEAADQGQQELREPRTTARMIAIYNQQLHNRISPVKMNATGQNPRSRQTGNAMRRAWL